MLDSFLMQWYMSAAGGAGAGAATSSIDADVARLAARALAGEDITKGGIFKTKHQAAIKKLDAEIAKLQDEITKRMALKAAHMLVVKEAERRVVARKEAEALEARKAEKAHMRRFKNIGYSFYRLMEAKNNLNVRPASRPVVSAFLLSLKPHMKKDKKGNYYPRDAVRQEYGKANTNARGMKQAEDLRSVFEFLDKASEAEDYHTVRDSEVEYLIKRFGLDRPAEDEDYYEVKGGRYVRKYNGLGFLSVIIPASAKALDTYKKSKSVDSILVLDKDRLSHKDVEHFGFLIDDPYLTESDLKQILPFKRTRVEYDRFRRAITMSEYEPRYEY